jgi:hypothetical protein
MPVGHPLGSTKLTPELAKEICDAIKVGSWLEVAADSCGIDRVTLKRWQKRGHKALALSKKTGEPVPDEEKIFASFVVAVKQANAECEIVDIKRVNRSAKKIWQAAAWRLERRYPERWRQRSSTEVSGPGGKAMAFIEQRLGADMVAKLLKTDTGRDLLAQLTDEIAKQPSGDKPPVEQGA